MGEGDVFAFVEVVVVVVVVVVVEVVMVVVVVVVVVVVGRGSLLGLDPLAWPLAAWSSSCTSRSFALFRWRTWRGARRALLGFGRGW